MTTKRYRKRYDFRLNILKGDEYQIAEQIEALKKEGRYSKTIRDGIRLVCDLQEGNLDVLFELFPWLKTELQPVTPVVVETTSDQAIKEQLDRLEKLMVGQGSVPINQAALGGQTASSNGQRGPKAMAVPQFSVPNFDDDLGELVIKKDTSTDSARNFINSMLNLQQ